MSSPTPLPLGDLAKLNLGGVAGINSEKPGFWFSNPVFSFFNDAYSGFTTHRQDIGLQHPGTIEKLSEHVTDGTFFTRDSFTGLKASFNKIFNINPVFQTVHTLTTGGAKTSTPYSFVALTANEDYFCQGVVGSDKSLMARAHYTWAKGNESKFTYQASPGEPAMYHLEQDLLGVDHSVNFRAVNPQYLDGDLTGIFTGSILQSITKKFAIGLETHYQKQSLVTPPDAMTSYFAKYNAGDWIATGQISGQGAASATFWRKVSDKLEAGIETALLASVRPIADPLLGQIVGLEPIFNGVTTVGAKYQFRQSIFKAQIDSDLKVGANLQHYVLPSVAILFSSELDHSTGANKLGLGLQFESPASEEVALQQQALQAQYAEAGALPPA